MSIDLHNNTCARRYLKCFSWKTRTESTCTIVMYLFLKITTQKLEMYTFHYYSGYNVFPPTVIVPFKTTFIFLSLAV